MTLYCIKCSKFTKNYNIKIECEIDGKINLYSHCFACGFKKFESIEKEELSYFFENLNYT